MPKKKKSSSSAQDTECFICHKELSSKLERDQHVQDVHGPRFDCQCAHCTGKRRHDSAKLAEEVTVKDDGKEVKTFKCIVCEYQVFLLCKCLSHIQTAHNTVSLQKQYECMKCNVGFEKCVELHNHILVEHPTAQKIARCGFSHCKKCFSNATLLQSHLRQNHKVTKPFELLNTIKGGQTPHIINKGSNNASLTDNASGSTSAWLAPDPPSPTPPKEEKLPAEKTPDPELTCKICSKTHKSQTSYNNHMLVFHKQKTKPAKKRRRNDDDEESDLTSEDSDWEPSNSRAKRTSTRPARTTTKKQSSGTESSGGRNVSGGKSRARAANYVEGSVSDTGPGNISDSIQHNSHPDDDCSNCLACKQAQKLAALPPVKIKQEPVDSNETPNPMPVISNVFSMTSPSENSFDNNHSADQERSPSVGSNYSSSASTALTYNSERANNSYNLLTGSPPSNSTWQQQQAPVANGNLTNNDLCSNCLSQRPDENKCVHCGIIFMDAPMHMIHMLWHGEKHPFQCHSCGKICKDKYSFTTHIFKAQHLSEPHH